jgi:SAM-dependent methyltransferase
MSDSILKKIYRKLFSPEPASKTPDLEQLSVKERFEYIFKNNSWYGKESKSGAGSDLEQTKTIIEKLPALFSKFQITSVLDVPCGDFNWMRKVNLNGIQYTGADVVDGLIANNSKQYNSESIKFVTLDIINDKLPDADLLLCRDCLVHFSFEDINKVLANLKRSNIEYLLTTSFTERKENTDIETGDWRTLNLQLPPFNFPEPLYSISENCTEDNMKYTDKSLLLWHQNQLTK